MDSHNKDSRNVRRSGQCKGLPVRDTSALASALALTARTFIVCPRCENRVARLSGTREKASDASDEHRPSAALECVFSLSSRGVFGRAIEGSLSAWNAPGRGMCRAAQPARVSGRKRSGPRSSPVAAAATTPTTAVCHGPFRGALESSVTRRSNLLDRARSKNNPFASLFRA
jgi:hypothetical protein